MQLAAFKCLAQRLARAEKMALADKLVEISRPHAIGQRAQRIDHMPRVIASAPDGLDATLDPLHPSSETAIEEHQGDADTQ